ncbi:hypothetical protein [Chryseobacterium binzhouense]|uniref:hypothetical protein n=1 Tax=Chryseobacterium binzhouense TaxID=2593646 RepID=UPI00117C848E|nr:hypothetical protein [Chryseobacterium binzhouense]
MNKLLILFFATILSCTGTTAQKTSSMQNQAEILVSETQGGTEKQGFRILNNRQELADEIKDRYTASRQSPIIETPAFPKDKKVVVYYMGTFSSGDHQVNEIKNISVKNNTLFIEIPEYESGGMAIQVMSNPWFVFSVPESYQFTSVQLKSSK